MTKEQESVKMRIKDLLNLKRQINKHKEGLMDIADMIGDISTAEAEKLSDIIRQLERFQNT